MEIRGLDVAKISRKKTARPSTGESALMAQAIAASSDVPPERRQALLRLWVMGVFDACAAGLEQGVG